MRLLRRLVVGSVFVSWAIPFALAETPSGMPWDLKALSRVPKVYPAPEGFQAEGVRSLMYEGEPYQGKPTRVFAYYGCPKGKPGSRRKVPAMVLVHGGGGTAFDKWVRAWNAAGYAAIAMDTCGGLPKRQPPPQPAGKPAAGKKRPKRRRTGWMRHEHSGPNGWGDFGSVDKPVKDQWTYHAVAAVVLAHSLIGSFDEVDADRTGLTGISWGGYLTCITSGVDSRFKLAVPVYGCGFLGEDSAWSAALAGMGAKGRTWLRLWDPSQYLRRAGMPMLWATGTNDFAYPFHSLQKSYRLPKGPRTLAIRVRYPHGHQWGPKEIYALADHVLKGGKPLARVTEAGRSKRTVWAAWDSPSPIAKAELIYTKDKGKWQKRMWHTAPADVQAGTRRVSATLPDGTTVYYLNLTDKRGLLVSTEHALTDASADWPAPKP